MQSRLIWDPQKQQANLAKHGLDFGDAHWVLDSDIRLDVTTIRQGEQRIQSFAYVYETLRVLSLVHAPAEQAVRIISYRTASAEERRLYHDWLSQDDTP